MKNQNLLLEFIEFGRMSDDEMNEIYGGDIFCSTYHICKKEFGKWKCVGYFDCTTIFDPNQRNYCGKYQWVAMNFESFESFELSCINVNDSIN